MKSEKSKEKFMAKFHHEGGLDQIWIWVEKEIERVKSDLLRETQRLASREGNAVIKLLKGDKYPFSRVDLKIVDYGVADNIYVVEE